MPDEARRGGQSPLLRRLLWFAGLWLAGLATITVVAYGLRALIL